MALFETDMFTSQSMFPCITPALLSCRKSMLPGRRR